MYLFVLSIICLFSATSCVSYGQDLETSVSVDLNNPLEMYRKGNVRRVIDIFEANPDLANSLDLCYIWGSSYLEVRNYRKAFEIFYRINADELYSSSQYSFLYPFYVRKYLETLIELKDPNLLTLEEDADVLKMVSRVSKNSPIRKYIDKQLFSILFQYKDYSTIRSVEKNISDLGAAWIEIAKHAQGESYNLSTVLKVYEEFGNNTPYSNLIADIEPSKITIAHEAQSLAKMSLKVSSQRDKALQFASRYADLSQDHEYLVLVNADVLRLKGLPNDGALLLYDYIISNTNVSPSFYTNTHAFLVSRKFFDLAADIALLGYARHNQNFYHHVDNAIEFSKIPNHTLRWYQKNYKNISAELHNAVIRSLIRSDIKTAETASDLGWKENLNNPNFILVHGLIKEHFNKREQAYLSYLRLIFQDPFGYSGIVARQKERAMRNEFRALFDNAVKKMLKGLPLLKLQDRLMINKAMAVDDELVKFVDKSMMVKDQKAFDKKIMKDINNIPNIPLLEKYNHSLSNFAPETQDYVENSVLETINNAKGHDKARYYFKYRDILLNSEIYGHLTFRLYFYVRDMYGYAYLPIFPKEIVNLVFPKPEFNMIKELSGNDLDLAYWMLSSFMAESHFRKRVYSKVGAVGFAQVMPYTAADIKKWMKKPCFSNHDFYDNLSMGVFYHEKMYRNMDDNIILSLAAYNAGPGAVNRWKKQFSEIKDDYLLIEAFPYKETRNYVKIIIYNHGMYRLLNDHADTLYPK